MVLFLLIGLLQGPLPTAPARVVGECSGAQPKKMLYRGQCLTAAQLTAAYECPAGAKVHAEDNSMFWERDCLRPDGKRIGEKTLWVATADSSGRPLRRRITDADGNGEFFFYHVDGRTIQHHQVAAGELHGLQLQFHLNGQLQERFYRRAGKIHGLSTEYSASGERLYRRCLHLGQLLWKHAGAGETPACPPKGFSADDLPDNAPQIWLKAEDGAPYSSPWSLKSGPKGGFYFLSHWEGGRLWHLPGPQQTPRLVADYQNGSRELVIRGGTAFLLGMDAVLAVDLETEVTLAVARVGGEMRPRDLHLSDDGRRLLWLEPADEETQTRGHIMAVRPGGKPRSLFSTTRDPEYMMLHGQTVYWAEADGGVFAGALEGGATERLFEASGQVYEIAVFGKRLFWLDRHSRGVQARPLGAAPSVEAASLGDENGRFFQSIGDNLFWLGSDGLFRGALDGAGDVHALTTDTVTPTAMLVRERPHGAPQLCWADRVTDVIACIDHRARKRRFGEAL